MGLSEICMLFQSQPYQIRELINTDLLENQLNDFCTMVQSSQWGTVFSDNTISGGSKHCGKYILNLPLNNTLVKKPIN